MMAGTSSKPAVEASSDGLLMNTHISLSLLDAEQVSAFIKRRSLRRVNVGHQGERRQGANLSSDSEKKGAKGKAKGGRASYFSGELCTHI
jgi:hypothetical protein